MVSFTDFFCFVDSAYPAATSAHPCSKLSEIICLATNLSFLLLTCDSFCLTLPLWGFFKLYFNFFFRTEGFLIFVHLSTHLPIHSSIQPSINPSIHPFTNPSFYRLSIFFNSFFVSGIILSVHRYISGYCKFCFLCNGNKQTNNQPRYFPMMKIKQKASQ